MQSPSSSGEPMNQPTVGDLYEKFRDPLRGFISKRISNPHTVVGREGQQVSSVVEHFAFGHLVEVAAGQHLCQGCSCRSRWDP